MRLMWIRTISRNLQRAAFRVSPVSRELDIRVARVAEAMRREDPRPIHASHQSVLRGKAVIRLEIVRVFPPFDSSIFPVYYVDMSPTPRGRGPSKFGSGPWLLARILHSSDESLVAL